MHTVLILSAARPAPHPPSPGVVWLWARATVLVLAAAYSISIRRHPYRPCRKCGESGKCCAALKMPMRAAFTMPTENRTIRAASWARCQLRRRGAVLEGG